jgi:glycosyltransferase involved in cell wall biosynthesis
MNTILNKFWLLSREPGTGGTNTVVKIAKEIISEAHLTYLHAYIKDFSSTAKTVNGLNCRSLPLPVYLNNFLAGRKWKETLRKLPYGLVIGGTPAAGGIAYAAGIDYGMWIGTSVKDEYRIIKIKEEIKDKHYSRILNKVLAKLNNIVEAAVLRRTRFIITQSEYTKDCIIKDYNINYDKITYLPFPIEINIVGNKKYNDNGPVLLGVGRVGDSRKNYSFMLKAFKHFIEFHPHSRLRIVGTISADSKIVQESVKLGISSYINYLGEISSIELKKEYENADIFVLTPKQEGLGIVFLEAMSYGLPVVSTKCGGSGGIIQDGVNGYLIEQNDVAGFVGALENILASRATYEEMSYQAGKYILENHNPREFSSRFLDIIQAGL